MLDSWRWMCHKVCRSAWTPDTSDATLTINRWNFCFVSTETEQAFVKSKSEHLIFSLQVMSLFAIMSSCGTIALRFTHGPIDISANTERIVVATWGVIFYWGVQTVFLTKILKVGEIITPKSLEIYSVTGVLVFMVSCPLIQDDYARRFASLFDGSSVEERSCSDGRLLSCLNIALVGSHFGVPVRSCVLYVTEIAVVIIYLGLYLLVGGCENSVNFLFTCWTLLILAIMTAYGKRVGELSERMYYHKYVHEKVLRFETEHVLSKVSKDKSRRGVVAQSLPSTTSSSKVFDDSDIGQSKVLELAMKEQWYVDATELEIARDEAGWARELGAGAFGVVYLGHFFGGPVAVKAFVEDTNRNCREVMFNEMRILRRIRHPNIVQFYGVCLHFSSLNMALIMEFVNGKQLGHVLETEITSAEDFHMKDVDRLVILIGVGCALGYLHSRFPIVVHGDLKSDNILLELLPGTKLLHGVYNPKLVDFGLSRAITRRARPLGGSLEWVAPEVVASVEGAKPDPAADVFSFGRLMQHVLTSKLIFQQAGCSLLQQLKSGEAPKPVWPAHIRVDLISECKDMGDKCVSSISACRPNVSHVHSLLVSVLQKRLAELQPKLEVTRKFPQTPSTSVDEFSERFLAQLGVDVVRSVKRRQRLGNARDTKLVSKELCPNTLLPPKQILSAEQLRLVDEALKSLHHRDGWLVFCRCYGEFLLTRSLLSNHKCPSVPCGNGSDLVNSSTACLVSFEATAPEISDSTVICMRCGECLSVDSKAPGIARVDSSLTL
eukprot:TRINITY_DN13960_c0_g1_i1.p1 TRINITY_DN13960_c0_g1~~TRINITY_DN13960_c0_g1_i1.p1  ORF type:complete len:777 (-),score=89.15 TRINITY_DN13960_c0_g1_i1:81-2411(-)